MPRQLSMPFHRATMAAQAVLPHISADDVTPALTMAVVVDSHLIATDRYSVARFRLHDPTITAAAREDERPWAEVREEGTIEKDGPTWAHPFRIPRAALARIATLGKPQTTDGIWPETRVVIREEYGPLPKAGDVVKPHPSAAPDPLANREHFTIVEVHGPGERVEFAQRFRNPKGIFPPVARLFDEWTPHEGQPVLMLMGKNLDKVTKFAGPNAPVTITAGAPIAGKNTAAPARVNVGPDFVALLQPTSDSPR